MNDRIVFFNTGWMDFYRGTSNDTIIGGGKRVDSQGWGGEVFNFKKFEERVYGYVQPIIDKKHGNPSIIKIEKIGGSKEDEKLTNVTVVWTASDPKNGGTYFVGWYLNATVYRYCQVPPRNSNRRYRNNSIGFYATGRSKDSRLLSDDERKIRIYRAQKNWMGQSNVWYADNNPEFVKLVKEY